PAFSGLHIPGSWHIDLAGTFATQAGWVLPPDREIFLVAENRDQALGATLELRRVGFDRVVGFLAGGIRPWAMHGYPVATVPIVSPAEADALVRAKKAVILDVREREEWDAGHAKGSVHIPWHDLRTRHTELDPGRQYIVMCRGGQRASIAASILKMHGFSRVMNLAGGYAAYRKGRGGQ
ncbi:MAG: rhodanese-like domain-containing protein, partial [Methanomicrobiales archaeon]|nr:rhodanese-like domain-containing protein [Methanomicrobiales archaeon]